VQGNREGPKRSGQILVMTDVHPVRDVAAREKDDVTVLEQSPGRMASSVPGPPPTR
jgi:hypothetical protein